VYRTAIKLQKNESGNGSIWNQFYIKDVYLNKFNIRIVNMSQGSPNQDEVGDFFTLVSMMSPNFCQKAKF
jgi:hypothetical protein